MAHSLARIAEDLVRGGRGDLLDWQGVSLSSHFQPLYSARTPGCVGFEALVRAADAGGSPIRPQRLFEQVFAEGDGLLLDWICRALHLRKFATVDPGELTLYVNVHPEAAARDAKSAPEFAQLIGYYGLTPQRVCVEILEGERADDGQLREAVAAYRSLGVAIAMDDFGVGRSNFDRVVALRPDLVKIDRSVLVGAVGGEKARRMLPSIVEMLHETGAKVAVEGIEGAEEALIALAAGADLLQGHHFASPAPQLPEEARGKRILADLLRLRSSRLAAV